MNAVFSQPEQLAPDALGLVDLGDLFIRRILRCVYPIPSQQADDQPVEVFRAGADEDLLRQDGQAAAAHQIPGDGLS